MLTGVPRCELQGGGFLAENSVTRDEETESHLGGEWRQSWRRFDIERRHHADAQTWHPDTSFHPGFWSVFLFWGSRRKLHLHTWLTSADNSRILEVTVDCERVHKIGIEALSGGCCLPIILFTVLTADLTVQRAVTSAGFLVKNKRQKQKHQRCCKLWWNTETLSKFCNFPSGSCSVGHIGLVAARDGEMVEGGGSLL